MNKQSLNKEKLNEFITKEIHNILKEREIAIQKRMIREAVIKNANLQPEKFLELQKKLQENLNQNSSINEVSIPNYNNPVLIGCDSPETASFKIELGYSGYDSSLFYVGDCYDEYDALETVVNYLEQNNLIDLYTSEQESYEEFPDDFIEVNGYPLQKDKFQIERLH